MVSFDMETSKGTGGLWRQTTVIGTEKRETKSTYKKGRDRGRGIRIKNCFWHLFEEAERFFSSIVSMVDFEFLLLELQSFLTLTLNSVSVK